MLMVALQIASIALVKKADWAGKSHAVYGSK